MMKNLVAKVVAAKAKLEETTKLKSQLISENAKVWLQASGPSFPLNMLVYLLH